MRRYAQQLGETFLQSVFVEMFGEISSNYKRWDVTTIGDVILSSQYGTSHKSNNENKGYPILGMANITYEGRIEFDPLSYVELSEKELKNYVLKNW